MAEKQQQKQHQHTWVEQGRYLPFHPRDTDPAYNLPEPRRDADGNVEEMDHANWEAPDPYVWWDCADPACPEIKRVKIPKGAADRLREMLDSGDVLPEHLSQLPLGELIPELAEHQTKGSGAARIAYSGVATTTATDDEGGAS